ncbi:MAG: hypothetical protein VX589_17345 [Myxococcota bacterium]|nr:hypothetical protein [Myxococcota bacterium]
MKILVLTTVVCVTACLPTADDEGDGPSQDTSGAGGVHQGGSVTAEPSVAGEDGAGADRARANAESSGQPVVGGRIEGIPMAAGTKDGEAGSPGPGGGERVDVMVGGRTAPDVSDQGQRGGERGQNAGGHGLPVGGHGTAGRSMGQRGETGGDTIENTGAAGLSTAEAGSTAGRMGLAGAPMVNMAGHAGLHGAGMRASDIAMAGTPETADMPAEVVGGEVQQNQAGMALAGGTAQQCTAEPHMIRPTTESIPRVMVVVDRSWSMLQDEDRWTPVVMTIGRVTASLADQVKFGLLLFPNADQDAPPDNAQIGACLASGRNDLDCADASAACLPGFVNVEPALDNADVIRQALAGNRPVPNSGTPTASALHAAQEFLRAAPTGRDIVVLATDGGPGCNFGLNAERCICMNASCRLFGNSEMCLDDTSTLGRVRAMAEQNIQTLVLGISIGLPVENGCVAERCFEDGQACVDGQCLNQTPPLLDAMAIAGGLDVDGRHYGVNRLENIDGQLSRALGRHVSCRYALNDVTRPRNHLGVRIDGIEVGRDAARLNGWEIDGDDIIFYGDACERLRDGQAHTVETQCIP